MFVLVVFLFAVSPGNVDRRVDGKLTTIGHNAAVHVGSIANITCATDNLQTLIDWEYHSPNRKVVVYQYGRVTDALKDKFHVRADQRAGRSDLVIKNITLADAGTYRCYESADSRQRMDTELIIIALHKFCVIEAYNDIAAMEVSCTAFYRGSIRPTIDCEPSDGGAILTPRDNLITYKEVFYSRNRLATTCWLHFNVSDMPVVNWTMKGNEDLSELTETAADAEYSSVDTLRSNSETSTTQYDAYKDHYIVIMSTSLGAFLLVALITVTYIVYFRIAKRRPNDLEARNEVPLSDIRETAIPVDLDETVLVAGARESPVPAGVPPDDRRLSEGSSYEEVSAGLSTIADSLPRHDQLATHMNSSESAVATETYDQDAVFAQDVERLGESYMVNAAVEKRYLRLDPTTRDVDPPPVYTRLAERPAHETHQMPSRQPESTNQPSISAAVSDIDDISSAGSRAADVRNDKPYVRLDPGTRVAVPSPSVYARLA